MYFVYQMPNKQRHLFKLCAHYSKRSAVGMQVAAMSHSGPLKCQADPQWQRRNLPSAPQISVILCLCAWLSVIVTV